MDRLQTLHELGYLHCDIKPDNLLVAQDYSTSLEKTSIYLIDFGVSKIYLDDRLDHIPFRKNVNFHGNAVFASENAQAFWEQSRRDDMISLIYLLIFFINGRLEWLAKFKNSEPNYFKKVAAMKQSI